MPKSYSERSVDVVGSPEDYADRQKLMKTRPGFFKDEKHSQESIMRGLEEADDAEKNIVSRGFNKVKKGILGSDVDNELATERMRKMDARDPSTTQAKVNRALGMKKGGSVSKSDMQKAGFYDKDKTKSERQAIVSKVTTKPQRVAMVEKAFSSKNMKAGGMASRRADGCAIRGKTRA